MLDDKLEGLTSRYFIVSELLSKNLKQHQSDMVLYLVCCCTKLSFVKSVQRQW
jgi:Trp operon repressor